MSTGLPFTHTHFITTHKHVTHTSHILTLTVTEGLAHKQLEIKLEMLEGREGCREKMKWLTCFRGQEVNIMQAMEP